MRVEGLRVNFDGSRAPGAHPEGMGILLYPTSGHSHWRYNLRPSGGTIEVADGHYDLITFNNDTEDVLFENDGAYATLCAVTREASLTDGLSLTYGGAAPPRGRDADQPVMAQPDMMWRVLLPGLAVVRNDTVTLAPEPVVATYTITVDSVENLESAAQMCMAVSGLSVARVLADSVNVDWPITVPGSIARLQSASLRGQMLTFGDCASARSNTLFLYFWLRDGQKRLYQFDVSAQVASAPDPMNVDIRVARLQLPVTQTPDSGEDAGMDVGVDNWETVDIELYN